MTPIEKAKVEQPVATEMPAAAEGAPSTTKRDAIISAGTRVFMEQGFEPASMDEIARLAAVSKATIYSHFESKQALFDSVVTSRCQALHAVFAEPSLDDRPPAEALTLIGQRFLDLLVSPGSLSFYRLVVGESVRFPELGRAFYNAGPNRVAGALADYLARQHERGTLHVPEPRRAAEQFLGMVMGHLHLRTLLAVSAEPPSPEDRARNVANAVRIFLDGTARKP